jgi:hypothetical protein
MGQLEKFEENLQLALDKITCLEKDLFYFRNASNRHEAVIGEIREEEDRILTSIYKLKGKVQALEEYCADNREDNEEEEECEEEICPDCKEAHIKEVFEQEQQKLKIYVKTLGIALKELSKHLEDLERA